tara:strand:- start:1613 stop:1744 length:132 start_codon:yes stop_codon:yes gene_type:complete
MVYLVYFFIHKGNVAVKPKRQSISAYFFIKYNIVAKKLNPLQY